MEWEVASPESHCCMCGRSFDEREDYYSVLLSEGEGFARSDYCIACWQGPGEDTFSYWRTRTAPKPAPPKRFVNDEVMLEFFDRLSKTDDERRCKLRFIMAVLLLRKRLLREKSRRRDAGGRFWILECKALGKTYEVRDEGLIEEEMADILAQIGRILNVEIPHGGDDESAACTDGGP